MGRTPELGTVKNGHPTYKTFDMNRFSAPGVRNFVATNAGYFSIDGGNTDLKGFNITPPGDADDWLGPTSYPDPTYVPDSFNAFSAWDNTNSLTPVDAEVMDILGYNRASASLTMNAGYNDFLVGNNWSSPNQSGLNPFHGALMLINSSSATAHHEFTAGENFVLASNSDMGQSMEVRAGFLELNDSGSVTGPGFGLLVNQDGTLIVDGSGQLYAQGPISIGENAGVTNGLAEFTGGYVIIGNPSQSETFYVGDYGSGTVIQNGTASVTTPSLVLGEANGSFGGYTLADTATLAVTGNETIGYNGSANFTQNGGANKITGSLLVSAGYGAGTYDLAGGTLNASFVEVETGYPAGLSTMEQYGGTLTAPTVQVDTYANYYLENGNLFANVSNSGNFDFNGGLLLGNFFNTNLGTFGYTGGTLIGSFTNQGLFDLFSNFTVPYSFLNEYPFTLSSGITLTVNGSGIDNERYIYLSGGVLAGNGTKTNDGTIQGAGTISGPGALINNGTITEASGYLVFYMAGNPDYNYGTINLQAASGDLDISTLNSPVSDRLVNAGILNLNSSVTDGSGGLENASGGTIVGPGRINTAYFVNDAGGTISVPAGTFNIEPSFTNSGTINLTDPAANLTGGTITNNGTLEGIGTVASNVTNSGNIQPGPGTLTLSGTNTNSNDGTISIPSGSTVFLTSGLASNAGTINLAGGTLDNNGNAMSNAGEINGFGTINAGALNNNGHFGDRIIALSGGASTINAAVENNGTFSITGGSALINGSVNSGGGIIEPTDASLTITGPLISANYSSSNSVNVFQSDVTIVSFLNPTMSGGDSDQFYLSGGTFTNNGTFANTGLLESSDPTVNNGTFTQTGSLVQGGDFTNSATATLGGIQTWAVGTNFNNTAGIATFLSDAGSPTSSTLNMNVTGGSVVLASPQHWAGLSITNGADVDVSNNHLIISYNADDPISTILSYLATGYAEGAWTGAGLQSSSAAVNTHYALGCLDGASGLNPLLPSGEIEVAYTLYGDINLDGNVNGSDFAILAGNFGHNVTGGWEQGDLNYNGTVNGSDFSLLAGNFGKSATGQAITVPASDWAALYAFAAANGLLADVPEPRMSGVMAILLSTVVLPRRIRRKFATVRPEFS
jgi:fibronectin-binding autotransporter adhesin